MLPSLKYLIVTCTFPILVGTGSVSAAPQGFIEGHLKILSYNAVQPDDENTATVTAESYAEYPLIILRRGEKKEITRVTADRDGNYRAMLPPGDYILDVQSRVARRLRTKPQPFTVFPNETVHVDMTIVPGFGDEPSTPQQ